MAASGDPTQLNLPRIAEGQQGMYLTSNDADQALENAMSDFLAVTLSANVTLSGAQFTRAFTFVVSGNTSLHNLTVPATKRIFAVENNGSSSINVVCGATALGMEAGQVSIFKTDGTADGLKPLANVLTTAGGDLSGSFPVPTVVKVNGASVPASAAVLASNSSEQLVAATTTGSGNVVLATGPTLSNPIVGTQTSGDNSTKAASTAFVAAALSGTSGGLVYKGTWNASTNTPTITSATGTLGWMYKVATAGTTTIDGNSQWNVGDVLLFDGSNWDKLDGISTEVLSVAGLTGNISASGLKTALSIAATDVSGLATIATSGSASDLSAGTVPTARLPAVRAIISAFMPTVQASATQLIGSWIASIATTIPSGATNSYAKSKVAAAASTTFTLKQNGTSVGTIVFASSGTTGTWTVSSAVNLAAGDVLDLYGPATPDTALMQVAFSIYATSAVQ